MHIGNLRTALFAYLFAKSQNGKFILRIEDTDQGRYVEGAVDVIYETLKAARLYHDEGPDIGGDYGPYIQSERKGMYKKFALELVEKGAAYYCFCQKGEKESESMEGYDRHCRNLSREEVEAQLAAGKPYVIRQRIPLEGSTSWNDLVYGEISVENSTLDDQVLLKSDGMPTYNFANVVDDHLMQITHIIRGSEYLSSNPKYLLLYDAFGWERPEYIHLPIINGKNPDGSISKLSKRHGAVSFQALVEQGYLPEGIINYIALLGWSPKTEQEIFTMDELIAQFSITGVHKSPAVFDYQKLDWVNGQHISKMDPEEFIRMVEKTCLTATITHQQVIRHSGKNIFPFQATGLRRGALHQQEEQVHSGDLRRHTQTGHRLPEYSAGLVGRDTPGHTYGTGRQDGPEARPADMAGTPIPFRTACDARRGH